MAKNFKSLTVPSYVKGCGAMEMLKTAGKSWCKYFEKLVLFSKAADMQILLSFNCILSYIPLRDLCT